MWNILSKMKNPEPVKYFIKTILHRRFLKTERIVFQTVAIIMLIITCRHCWIIRRVLVFIIWISWQVISRKVRTVTGWKVPVPVIRLILSGNWTQGRKITGVMTEMVNTGRWLRLSVVLIMIMIINIFCHWVCVRMLLPVAPKEAVGPLSLLWLLHGEFLRNRLWKVHVAGWMI